MSGNSSVLYLIQLLMVYGKFPDVTHLRPEVEGSKLMYKYTIIEANSLLVLEQKEGLDSHVLRLL